MKDYGTVRSTVEPQEVEINETTVFVASDITEVEITTEEETHTEYEYNLIGYGKDEYIEALRDEIESLTPSTEKVEL